MAYLGIVLMKRELNSELLASENFDKNGRISCQNIFYKGKDLGSQEHHEVEGRTQVIQKLCYQH